MEMATLFMGIAAVIGTILAVWSNIDMEKIVVNVAWCGENFGATFEHNVPGAVVFTASTFEELQKESKETLDFHIQGLLEEGDMVPECLKNGDYEFVYNYVD